MLKKIFTGVIIIVSMAAAQTVLSGKITDTHGEPIHNAVVMVKTDGNILAAVRTLTNEQGNFELSHTSFELAALVVKKAGFLPNIQGINGSSGNMETIILERDPLEDRIDSVMAMMTIEDKIAQMTQPEIDGYRVSTPVSDDNTLYGSVLNGGDGYVPAFLNDMAENLNNWSNERAKIPASYGKDAVHGHAGILGCTVFPHNIGLGASRDSNLVRRIGEVTAKEMWATGVDLNFSPAITVAQDARWGRTYESFGERPELHVQMGSAMVRGLQGERFDAPWRVTATAKHYLGDGGTLNGKDRGNNPASDEEIRAIHFPGYEAVVEQGVLSVMASFNQIRETHQHIDSLRLTGWLKTELGFDGYIISDWLGIGNSLTPGSVSASNYTGGDSETAESAIKAAINAGIDLAMEPEGAHKTFMSGLTNLVESGEISEERINDAVRRILRSKFRAGRMDNPTGPAEYVYKQENIASAEHRAVARIAVSKSQTLLKNENTALPLNKNSKVYVFGSHSDNIGLQSGGWTVRWLGVNGNEDFYDDATSIYKGMKQLAPDAIVNTADDAETIVYVTGEQTGYAEWIGDLSDLKLAVPDEDITALANYRAQGKKIITVFVTGRPRIVPELINASDAFLVAWLPGTEGIGVADVLFGDYVPTAKLPIKWAGLAGVQFPYGYGLDGFTPCEHEWSEVSPIVIPATCSTKALATITCAKCGLTETVEVGNINPDVGDCEKTAIAKHEKNINKPLFKSNIVNNKLEIVLEGDIKFVVYDMVGNVVASGKGKTWNLRNSAGKLVANGSYLVTVKMKNKDGHSYYYSAKIGVKR